MTRETHTSHQSNSKGSSRSNNRGNGKGRDGHGGRGHGSEGRGKRSFPPLSAQEAARAGELGVSFLNDYFTHSELSVQANFEGAMQGELIFALEGDVRPLRRDAEGLSALTRLTQMALSSQRLSAPCVLDVQGSARARMELLETMAADVIDVVKHTQRRAVIEGLSSSERRKVHTMVSEDGALETESRGEGELRYMMLSPRT